MQACSITGATSRAYDGVIALGHDAGRSSGQTAPPLLEEDPSLLEHALIDAESTPRAAAITSAARDVTGP